MLDIGKARFVLSFVICTTLLVASADSHPAAQGAIGSNSRNHFRFERLGCTRVPQSQHETQERALFRLRHPTNRGCTGFRFSPSATMKCRPSSRAFRPLSTPASG
jgi:hypothetical protein